LINTNTIRLVQDGSFIGTTCAQASSLWVVVHLPTHP
jgi:hypothetical protein